MAHNFFDIFLEIGPNLLVQIIRLTADRIAPPIVQKVRRRKNIIKNRGEKHHVAQSFFVLVA